MKKIEEIYNVKEINKNLLPEYQQIIEILNQLEEYLQDNTFEAVDELENEEYREYHKLKLDLMRSIIKIVRQEEMIFNYEEIEEVWGNEEFWQEIKERVTKETDYYLKMKSIRQIEKKERKNYYLKIFHIQYVEYENVEYACEKLELDKNRVILLFCIINFSENIIFGQYYSKRRFISLIFENFGLDNFDAEILWNLFEENKDIVEKIALVKKLNNIEHRISRLSMKLNNMSEELDFVSNIILDVWSIEDEING